MPSTRSSARLRIVEMRSRRGRRRRTSTGRRRGCTRRPCGRRAATPTRRRRRCGSVAYEPWRSSGIASRSPMRSRVSDKHRVGIVALVGDVARREVAVRQPRFDAGRREARAGLGASSASACVRCRGRCAARGSRRPGRECVRRGRRCRSCRSRRRSRGTACRAGPSASPCAARALRGIVAAPTRREAVVVVVAAGPHRPRVARAAAAPASSIDLAQLGALRTSSAGA